MPPKPAPKGKPGVKGAKKLPAWAWVAAGLVGLAIGYFLLKDGGGSGGGGAGDEASPFDQAQARGGGGGGIGAALREALGLTPPDEGGGNQPGGSPGDGGGGGGDGGGDDGGGFDSPGFGGTFPDGTPIKYDPDVPYDPNTAIVSQYDIFGLPGADYLGPEPNLEGTPTVFPLATPPPDVYGGLAPGETRSMVSSGYLNNVNFNTQALTTSLPDPGSAPDSGSSEQPPPVAPFGPDFYDVPSSSPEVAIPMAGPGIY